MFPSRESPRRVHLSTRVEILAGSLNEFDERWQHRRTTDDLFRSTFHLSVRPQSRPSEESLRFSFDQLLYLRKNNKNMTAVDWEEVKRLAADFQKAQLSSTLQKLVMNKSMTYTRYYNVRQSNSCRPSGTII